MKQLILMVTFLVVVSTKINAQEQNVIEIRKLQNKTLVRNENESIINENHEFSIIAKEELDINLKFFLKIEDNVNVVVSNDENTIVLSKQYHKKGRNTVHFNMNKGEHYYVNLTGEIRSNLVVQLDEN